MPKKLIRQYLPNREKLEKMPSLRMFGNRLFVPSIWHLNKRSVSGAFSVGLFFAFMPAPFQMLLAAMGALLFRVNLPLSIALVWITNPLTMGPIFYGAYVLGAWVTYTPIITLEFSLSFTWLKSELALVWRPFLLGCLLLSIFFALTGNLLSRWLWQFGVKRNWHRRRLLRKQKQKIN